MNSRSTLDIAQRIVSDAASDKTVKSTTPQHYNGSLYPVWTARDSNKAIRLLRKDRHAAETKISSSEQINLYKEIGRYFGSLENDRRRSIQIREFIKINSSELDKLEQTFGIAKDYFRPQMDIERID